MSTARPVVLFAALILVCCGPGTSADSLDGASSGGTSSGGTSSGTGSTASPTTGASTTGDGCPLGPPIPEDDFPTTFAEAVCAGRSMCGCAPADCVATVTAALADTATTAKTKGYVYDPECAALFLASLGPAACDHQFAADMPCGPRFCSVYSGAFADGDVCQLEFNFYTDPCAGSLRCSPTEPNVSRCVELDLPPLQIGDPCWGEYWFTGNCPAGESYCDLVSDKCVATPGAGEACLEGQCDVELYCDDADTCIARKKIGESCGSLVECELLECEGGLCTASPWVCSDVWSAGT